MPKRALGLALTAAALLFSTHVLTTEASADIPPRPGYVEQCTVKKQQQKGETCTVCSTHHGDRDKCLKTLGKEGYSRRCKTRGASTWSEVWCKLDGVKKEAPGPSEKLSDDAGASASQAVAPALAGGAAGLLLIGGLLGRRRREG